LRDNDSVHPVWPSPEFTAQTCRAEVESLSETCAQRRLIIEHRLELGAGFRVRVDSKPSLCR
jgi:hypothetical protein